MKENIMNHLNTLSTEIGCRPVGTRANQEASNYIENVFKNSGLEVEIQEFKVPDWQLIEALIELNDVRLEAKGNNFSKPCDVSGEIVPFCTIEELASSSDLEGKIAFLYGELSKENYVPKGFTIYNPEHHQQTIRLLEGKKPSAIIFVRMEKGRNLPVINDWDFSIPSLTVSPEVGLIIKNSLPISSAKCVIESKRTQGKTRNIIGRVKGTGTEKIILTAHYDTVFETNGAFDNASGVALVLSLAEEIAKRKDWQTGFEFIAFSSEEYLGLGDELYLNEHKKSLKDAIVAMNFDGIGQALGTNNITLMSGSDELEADLKAIKREFPSVQWTAPWYESNHYTFFSNGVPSIPFSCSGVSDLLHTSDDTTQWICNDKLNEAYLLVLEIIKNLQGKTSEWTRR
ncbi:DUF4910 domain-containing protein [Pseudalkalibacillus caeni]|uniref:DUF4910 domain-containing protein n=1 Tax=Exobacillus caeni TaxID=2574798 RepID=A0A5R9EY27_9BACL|nr:DUF4910 domain-containing protein [Pseudalkalibacillus caeni]TLS36182.1 DUF4910 domain-containing protein [Pseudalkalibacillus caeni]